MSWKNVSSGIFNELLNRTFSKYFLYSSLLCPIFLHIPCCSKQELLHTMNNTIIVQNFSRKFCFSKVHDMPQINRDIFSFCQFKDEACAVISAC